jgi:hypothetical protein
VRAFARAIVDAFDDLAHGSNNQHKGGQNHLVGLLNGLPKTDRPGGKRVAKPQASHPLPVP